jgi:hypothetical protein
LSNNQKVDIASIRIFCGVETLPYTRDRSVTLKGSFARSDSEHCHIFYLRNCWGRKRTFFWADRKLGIAYDKHQNYFVLIE